jgi:prepilin-type N-terminal cleavage/methylation domain-containing protein
MRISPLKPDAQARNGICPNPWRTFLACASGCHAKAGRRTSGFRGGWHVPESCEGRDFPRFHALRGTQGRATQSPPSGCHAKARRRSAFTLLEVILALAILSGSLVVLGEICRIAVTNARQARDLARAQLLAESKMAELESQITPTAAADGLFDAENESLDPSEPGWRYSIKTNSTSTTGLLSVEITVTRDLPEAQRPAKFTLVQWLPDPNNPYTPPPPQAGSASTGS